MVRQADIQVTLTMQEAFVDSLILKKEVLRAMEGRPGQHQGQSGERGSEGTGNRGKTLYCGFHGKGRVSPGKHV